MSKKTWGIYRKGSKSLAYLLISSIYLNDGRNYNEATTGMLEYDWRIRVVGGKKTLEKICKRLNKEAEINWLEVRPVTIEAGESS